MDYRATHRGLELGYGALKSVVQSYRLVEIVTSRYRMDAQIHQMESRDSV